VGATLGEETIERGKWAAISGGLLVLLYMVMYYKLSGVWADLATVVNILMTIALLKFFGGSLTLSGIAGMMLTVGMAVDANVIIFERIKEELRAGKTVRASIDAGFDKAFLTIFDSNVTTILMAVVLYFFGSGPVKGFAVTLSLGLMANLFTAVFVVKVIMDMLYAYTTESTISI
jgi:preprotein translocase subunit SecD